MLLLPIRYVEVFPLTHLYTNTSLHFWPKDTRQIVVLLRISANFRLFLFIIEQPEVCWLIIFFLWICFCTCRDWKQCWMSRSQDPSRSRSPQSLAVLLPPVFKLQSDWILHKLWWHKWVSTANQWCCWSTNAYSFSSFFRLGGTRYCSFLMVELNFCAQKEVYYLHGLEIGAWTIACVLYFVWF